MPALNYSDQFAPLVESGRKPSTIRAMRKRPFKVGDVLGHYHGMRHPGCRCLGFSLAEEVLKIDIFWRNEDTWFCMLETGCGAGGQRRLATDEVGEIAAMDGFDSIAAFYFWFVGPGKVQHFSGQLIKWPTTWVSSTCPECGHALRVDYKTGRVACLDTRTCYYNTQLEDVH